MFQPLAEHPGRSVRQDSQGMNGAQALQGFSRVRERSRFQPGLHQPLPGRRSDFCACMGGGIVEGSPGEVPKGSVPAEDGGEEGVLQLLAPPYSAEGLRVIGDTTGGSSQRRDVYEGAVHIEQD